MSSLYEIAREIESLIDPETGEILDISCFAELRMALDQKTENIALWIKNLDAESSMISAEIEALSDRKRIKQTRAARLRSYLSVFLGGQKFETARVHCSYRKSTVCKVDEAFPDWAARNKDAAQRFLVEQPPRVDLTAVKSALKAGEAVPHAYLEEKQNLQIK